MSVAGNYECVTKTPMGDQKSTLTVIDNGDGTFSGKNAGAMGALDINDGKIDGNTLTWTMNMVVPMPMKLEGTATVDGDTITGSINAGAFGAMALSGTRVG